MIFWSYIYLAFTPLFQALTKHIAKKKDRNAQKQGDFQLFCGRKQYKMSEENRKTSDFFEILWEIFCYPLRWFSENLLECL